MPIRSISLLCRPDSESEISRIADYLLRKAGAVGKLPTPVGDLIALAGVEDVPNSEVFKEHFLASLPQRARAVFESAWQKIRGIADLRERAVYVPKTTTAPRVLFAKAHELGHQVIPWQKLNRAYLDDKRSLTSAAEDLFDLEANFFAADVIFQGHRFANRVRDYAPSFDAVSLLADEHGASKHATLHRYVEEHDETIAAIPYWPSFYTADEDGYPVLRAGKVIGSPRFVQKYAGVQLPLEIRTGHEWAAARDASQVCAGNIRLDCGAGPVNFRWQSWWNTYCLLVLLRRKPALSLVGRLVNDSNL